MFKYRDGVIFSLGLLFSVKAVTFTDAASVALALAFLAVHMVDRFYSAERVEAKIVARVTALEDTHKSFREDLSHVKLSQGMRSGGR